jgi:hypothetical protein
MDTCSSSPVGNRFPAMGSDLWSMFFCLRAASKSPSKLVESTQGCFQSGLLLTRASMTAIKSTKASTPAGRCHACASA